MRGLVGMVRATYYVCKSPSKDRNVRCVYGEGEAIDGGNGENCVLMFTLKKQ